MYSTTTAKNVKAVVVAAAVAVSYTSLFIEG